MKGSGDAIASAVVEVRNPLPGRVLARGVGEARGYFGSGPQWVAWIGRAASIEVGGEALPSGGVDRFERVRRAADAILGGSSSSGEAADGMGSPRFYGGFSFWPGGPSGNSREVWNGFHAASFILPAVEVRVEEGRATLRVNRRVSGEDDFTAARQEARARALRLREELSWMGGAPAAGADQQPRSTTAGSVAGDVLRRETSEAEWMESVRSALARISEDRFTKAVLARTLDITAPAAIEPADILLRFRDSEPRSHVFLFQPGADTAFLGASPEVLSEVAGRTFCATAVAGSAPRGDDPALDDRLGQELRASAKEQAEQRIVHQEMARELDALADRIRVDAEPRLLKLSRIQHLESSLHARLAADTDILQVLAALHPTPAVSGHPRGPALAFLRREEPFERGWYGAPVGWFDGAGDGIFVPGLRSLVGGGRAWRLFAGAGIVEGSDPEREWRETRMKFGPALRALGLSGDG